VIVKDCNGGSPADPFAVLQLRSKPREVYPVSNYYGDDDDLYLDPEVEDLCDADEDQEAAPTAAERNPSLR